MGIVDKNRFRTALEWAGLLAVAALAAAAIDLHFNSERQTALAQERARLTVLTHVVASQIEIELGAVDRALEGVVKDHLAGPAGPSDASLTGRRLRALVDAMPAVRAVSVLNGEGSVVASSQAPLPAIRFADRAFFQEAMTARDPNQLSLSAPFRSLRGDDVVTATRVQRGQDGAPRALVVAGLDPAHFRALVAPLLYAPDLRATLASANGVWLDSQPRTLPESRRLRVQRTVLADRLRVPHPMLISLERDSAALLAPLASDAARQLAIAAGGFVCAALALAFVQRRRAQLTALAADNARARGQLEAVFDNLNEAVLLFDAAHTLVRANRSGHTMHGLFNPGLSLAALSAALQELDVTGTDGTPVARADSPLYPGAAGRFVREQEFTLSNRDSGRTLVGEITTAPMRDPAGATGWVLTCRDVSERRQALALRISETRFRTLIEDAPLAIAILRQGLFLYTNPRYRLLHGYAAGDDLQGLPWRAMLAPQSWARLEREEALIRADSAIELQFEALGLGKAGELVPVMKTTAQVALNDGVATLIFVQDISAQKRAEAEMLTARDAAERANRAKADFLANMSHEIRSPLNAILGLGYLLGQSRLPEDAADMVRRLRTAGSSLLGIVNDILDVSKIEAGHMHIEQAPFRLDDVIERIAASMGLAVSEKPVELVIHPLPAAIGLLRGDALRLEQILLNLTSNAIKFTAAGSVELACEVVSHDGTAVALRFEVRDSGIGIDPAIQADMFSPFTQADNSTTRRFGGTGLGLTICRHLVGLMGGTIGVHSNPGLGSTFHVCLTFDDIGGAEPQPQTHDLMVVAASTPAGEGALAVARSLGWRVTRHLTGEAALASLRHGAAQPDAVLVDSQLPGMDGIATVQALRALAELPACPIILMASAYASAALARERDAELVDALLTKPLTGKALAGAFAEARARRGKAVRQLVGPDSAGSQLAGLRVLVVDDSDFNRDLIARVLAAEGAQMQFAANGKEALAQLEAAQGRFDVVLMDVQMPVMDGLTATRHLRQMDDCRTLPVIALTAGAFTDQRALALAAGVDYFVSKPFDVPALVAQIQAAARHEAPAQAPAPAPAATATDAQALDVARGLAIWTDMEQFRHYLRWFGGEYGAASADLARMLETADYDGARAYAHKLAGVAGNLGLPGVLQTASALERALVNRADAGAALALFDTALTLALAAIARFETSEIA